MSDLSDIADQLDAAVQRQEELDQWINAKQDAYEERIVKLILTRFDLGPLIPYYKRELKDNVQHTNLNTIWFREKFYDFPVYLGTASTVFSHELSLSDLYKRLTNTAMFKKFSELEEELRTELTALPVLGLVFPWAKMGNMILHTYDTIEPSGTRIIRKFDNGRATVFLDSFNEFLNCISKLWIPNVEVN